MATDYTQKERLFISSLEQDTGADLAGWLRAIDLANLTGRNAIIDWLRQQGFTFANASWLERIHHNGGKLIYGEGASGKLALVRALAPDSLSGSVAVSGLEPDPDPELLQPQRNFKPRPISVVPAPDISRPPVTPRSADVAALLAVAKGLRPLAEVVIGEVLRAVPSAICETDAALIVFKAPLAFAALLPGPKELRLFGDFGEISGLAKRAEASQRTTPPFARVIVLNDARQVTPTLTDTIRAAQMRVNG